MFGEPIRFNWNKSECYKTKTGVMFTALFVLVLGFIIYSYFGEFISCTHPNVFESNSHASFQKSDPDNDLTAVFPVFSFLDYSRAKPWPKRLPAVPFSDITCHFTVEFTHNTVNSWLNTPGAKIPMNGDCNAKFKEIYKQKTGRTDETLTEQHYLTCPDTDKLPLIGDGENCNDTSGCSYYDFKILPKSGSTAHCNPVSYPNLVISLSYI
jgi:hypothetical protein